MTPRHSTPLPRRSASARASPSARACCRCRSCWRRSSRRIARSCRQSRRWRQRKNEGLQAAFTSIFPISSHSGNARLEFVGYLAAAAGVRRHRMPAARPDLLLGAARQGPPDHHGQGSAQGDGQGSEGAGGLHGRDPAHDRQRLVHHQRHRARHRLAAAPLARACSSSTTAARRTSSGKLLFSARVIPYRGSWLDFEFDPKDFLFFRVDRRRKMPVTTLLKAIGLTNEDILQAVLRLRHVPPVARRARSIDFVPERLRGEVARFDMLGKDGKVIVAEGQAHHRPAHPRAGRRAASRRSPCPTTTSSAARSPTNVVDKDTGEILRQGQRRDHRGAARQAARRRASPRSTRSTPTTSTRVRTSRRRCKHRRHARPDARRASRSTA